MKHIKTSICAALLTAALSTSSFADCSYELFSISSAKNTKIIDFVEQLSDECGFSIVVTDPYAEKFLDTKLNKTNLKNLTIDEVLNLILSENNLTYTLENNLLKISYLTTKVYNIDYILSQRKSIGSTDITLSSSSGTSNISTTGTSTSSTTSNGTGGSATSSTSDTGIKIESTDEVKFWDQLDEEFVKVLNRPHDVYKASHPIINKNAGLITVTATNNQMKRFETYLKKLQEKVQLQVLIDVQLLTVTISEGQSTGIDWKQLYALQNVDLSIHHTNSQNVASINADDPTDVYLDSVPAAASNAFNGVSQIVSVKAGGSLNEVIKFLKTQGDVNSISNPKVLTLNNQPALITAGTEYFYKITSSTSTTTASTTTAQNEQINSVFAGVLLTITPEISNDNSITLKINPSLSETAQDISTTPSTGRDIPPDLNRRQLSSVVTVKDGNRIILGGLINTKNSMESNKVPILGDIPVINYLFKYEENIKQTQELVIIIEPHIIHKDKKNVSLSDLGYEGLSNELLTAPRTKTNDANKKDSTKTSSSNDVK